MSFSIRCKLVKAKRARQSAITENLRLAKQLKESANREFNALIRLWNVTESLRPLVTEPLPPHEPFLMDELEAMTRVLTKKRKKNTLHAEDAILSVTF